MSARKIDLLPQYAFAALSLAEKNQYLQSVSHRIAEMRGEGVPLPLDRESLSRLRRFYSRRRVSDLALEKTHD